MTPHDLSLSERMSSAARELQDEKDPQVTLDVAVRLAVANVDGCDEAAITITTRNRQPSALAGSHPTARECDHLQHELGEGPGVDAVHDTGIVHSPDLTQDERWPVWTARVCDEFGIGSVLSFRLFTHQDHVGALNLYSFTPRAYDERSVEDGLALAAHIAVAFVSVRRIAQLHEAMDSRTAIAAAVGMLMARFDLTYDRAFAVLGRISSDGEVKIRDLAVELLATGKLRDGN